MLLNNATLNSTGWTVQCIPLNNTAFDALDFQPVVAGTHAALYRGSFEVAQPADTFLAMRGWGKGQSLLVCNGHLS